MSKADTVTALCLDCGLCCDGSLHNYTFMEPKDRPRVAELGLIVVTAEGREAFKQPCHHASPTGCTVYQNRPHHCCAYECSLLKAVLKGEKSLVDAQKTIATAKSLLDRVRTALPTSDEPLWKAARTHLAALLALPNQPKVRQENAQLLSALTALEMIGQRDFMQR